MGPDEISMQFVDAIGVLVAEFANAFNGGHVVLNHVADPLGDVVALRFCEPHSASAVTHVGIRSVHDEQVGEVRHVDAEQCPRTIGPVVGKGDAVFPVISIRDAVVTSKPVARMMTSASNTSPSFVCTPVSQN